MDPNHINQFVDMYMPWMQEQRRRAKEQGILGVNNGALGTDEGASNLQNAPVDRAGTS